MQFEPLVAKLKNSLKQPLPGQNAQAKMAPYKGRVSIPNKSVLDKAKKAAVLLLLFQQNNEAYTVFIKRATYKGVHSAQVSFPGGKREEGDRNFTQTALRETEEEIGINRNDIEVIGQLSQVYIPPSNFLVEPFVGILNAPPIFTPDPYEVESILPISIAHIVNPQNHIITNINVRGATLKVPAIQIKNDVIWGATAIILAEFGAVIN